MTYDAHGLEMLDREACLVLLAEDEVGRLGVLAGGVPLILPVNYRLDGEAIVFRTDPGTKLDQGLRSHAAFEIDSFDRGARTGWSVVVQGRLEEVSDYDAATLDRVTHLPVEPWAGGDKAHWVRLIPSSITGRRVRPHAKVG